MFNNINDGNVNILDFVKDLNIVGIENKYTTRENEYLKKMEYYFNEIHLIGLESDFSEIELYREIGIESHIELLEISNNIIPDYGLEAGLSDKVINQMSKIYHSIKIKMKKILNFMFGWILASVKGTINVRQVLSTNYKKIKDYNKKLNDFVKNSNHNYDGSKQINTIKSFDRVFNNLLCTYFLNSMMQYYLTSNMNESSSNKSIEFLESLTLVPGLGLLLNTFFKLDPSKMQANRELYGTNGEIEKTDSFNKASDFYKNKLTGEDNSAFGKAMALVIKSANLNKGSSGDMNQQPQATQKPEGGDSDKNKNKKGVPKGKVTKEPKPNVKANKPNTAGNESLLSLMDLETPLSLMFGIEANLNANNNKGKTISVDNAESSIGKDISDRKNKLLNDATSVANEVKDSDSIEAYIKNNNLTEALNALNNSISELDENVISNITSYYNDSIDETEISLGEAINYYKASMDLFIKVCEKNKTWDFKKSVDGVERLRRNAISYVDSLNFNGGDNSPEFTKLLGNSGTCIVTVGNMLNSSKTLISSMMKSLNQDLDITTTQITKIGSYL